MDLSHNDLSQRVAEISTWRNNCALSCTAVFLANNLLTNRLSENAAQMLVDMFNDYYQTSLSVQKLKDFLNNVLKLPSDRQVVLGPTLRAFLSTQGVNSEAQDHDMLSNEAFQPLAEAFGFNVTFYTKTKTGIRESGLIDPITVSQQASLTLRPYYHDSHYDLIMDNDSAANRHNASSFELSEHDLPIEVGQEQQLQERVVTLIHDRLNPEQAQRYNGFVTELTQQQKGLNQTDRQDLQNLTQRFKHNGEAFFPLEVNQKMAAIDGFKHKTNLLIQKALAKFHDHVNITQILKNLLLCVATLGVGYLAAALINKAVTGNFFFFHPKNHKKNDEQDRLKSAELSQADGTPAKKQH